MNSILESIVLRIEAANCLEDKVTMLSLAFKEMPSVGLDVPPEVPIKTLPESQVDAIMESIENNQPFTVEFLKKDGNLRRMLCSVDREKKEGDGYAGLHTVFDREAGRIKSFRSAQVTSILVA